MHVHALVGLGCLMRSVPVDTNRSFDYLGIFPYIGGVKHVLYLHCLNQIDRASVILEDAVAAIIEEAKHHGIILNPHQQ